MFNKSAFVGEGNFGVNWKSFVIVTDTESLGDVITAFICRNSSLLNRSVGVVHNHFSLKICGRT
jgi:hypothetical protein